MTGHQKRVLTVIADAGPAGINSISKTVAKAAGSKPSRAVAHLKDLGYVENLTSTRVRATDAGIAALSNRKVSESAEDGPTDSLPDWADEIADYVRDHGRATVNEVQRELHRTFREVRPVIALMEKRGHLHIEHEPNPLCSVLHPETTP